MALKTPREQMFSDLAHHYNPDLPWVETASIGGQEMPARVRYGADPEAGGGSSRARAVIWIQKTDLPDKPAPHAEITLAGEEWSLVRIDSHNLAEWRLEIEADVRPTFRR